MISQSTMCKSLKQPGFYSLTWIHNVRFLKNKVYLNNKKKFIIDGPLRSVQLRCSREKRRGKAIHGHLVKTLGSRTKMIDLSKPSYDQALHCFSSISLSVKTFMATIRNTNRVVVSTCHHLLPVPNLMKKY